MSQSNTVTAQINNNPVVVPFELVTEVPMSDFGLDPTKSCKGFAHGHAHQLFVPEKSSFYKFRTSIRMPVMNWLYAPNGDSLALTGPTGSGKTSLIREIAAVLNWPYLQSNAHSRMEIPDLIGGLQLDCDPRTGDQRTVFRYGPLTVAMRDGFIFCLDEADFLDASVMSGLNSILEGGPIVIAENGGEVIRPHKNFRFIVTCNTRGQGDETGLMAGTQSQNLATWDRYRMIEVGYMEEADEIETLTHVLGEEATTVIDTMVKTANRVRAQFVGNPAPNGTCGDLTVTFSTRTLLRWARIGGSYSRNKVGKNPFAKALREALTNRAAPDQRVAIHVIARDLFGLESWIEDEVLSSITASEGLASASV